MFDMGRKVVKRKGASWPPRCLAGTSPPVSARTEGLGSRFPLIPFCNRGRLQPTYESMTQPLALVFYESLMPGSQVVNRLQDLKYRVQTINDPAMLLDCAQ